MVEHLSDTQRALGSNPSSPTMLLQLEPMLPVYVPKFDMEGYAFLVETLTQEHYTLFTLALDNGEIWILPNTDVRFCVNYTQQRVKINKGDTSEVVHRLKANSNGG